MQIHELKIGYKSKGSSYEVVMMSYCGAAFNVAAEHKQLKGEELVRKILATVPEDIAAVMRYKDGKESDGPSGQPCYEREFDTRGEAAIVSHVCSQNRPRFKKG